MNLDIISGSYVNGIARHTIYSFFPNLSPGHKIVGNPKTVIYLPITLHVIHSIQITLEDQDGDQLDIQGVKTLRFGFISGKNKPFKYYIILNKDV